MLGIPSQCVLSGALSVLVKSWRAQHIAFLHGENFTSDGEMGAVHTLTPLQLTMMTPGIIHIASRESLWIWASLFSWWYCLISHTCFSVLFSLTHFPVILLVASEKHPTKFLLYKSLSLSLLKRLNPRLSEKLKYLTRNQRQPNGVCIKRILSIFAHSINKFSYEQPWMEWNLNIYVAHFMPRFIVNALAELK